ncbi:MAG TPA: threonine/serine dehydratase [Rhizobiales bacterium]|nr:threonine/serine dehydratase [Hyphomicrobiales bacterium]
MKITATDISETFERITPFIRRTPIIDVKVPGIEEPVVLKLEQLQYAGSFKVRGAFASLLGADIPEAGVTAASGGNHGAALAYAAGVLGIKAKIFVPQISAPAKIARIRSFGADVVVAGENYAAALERCNAHMKKTGARNVHAYDSPATLTGQGTLAAELETQVLDGVDTVLMAVGGGGMIGGAAAWFEGRTRLVSVETKGCPTLHDSLAAGKRVHITPKGIGADSLGAAQVGKIMFPLARKFISKAVLVSDEDVRTAQKWLWQNLRLVTEPGGATALAALLSGRYKPEDDERLAVVICGGNTDLAALTI